MDSSEKKAPVDLFAAKRLARLMAVQALYQVFFEQESVDSILKRCIESPSDMLADGEEDEGDPALSARSPDPSLLGAIVRGVCDNRAALDEMVVAALNEKLSAGRMEPLLKAIVMAGAFELHQHGSIATGIIISDYVDVARAFFGAKEPGLVNAVLDRLAKSLRG